MSPLQLQEMLENNVVDFAISDQKETLNSERSWILKGATWNDEWVKLYNVLQCGTPTGPSSEWGNYQGEKSHCRNNMKGVMHHDNGVNNSMCCPVPRPRFLHQLPVRIPSLG